MAVALTVYFETTSGSKRVVQADKVKWAYDNGTNFVIEYFDVDLNGETSALITETTFDALLSSGYLQEVTVLENLNAPSPATGSLFISPFNVLLANNVGGLDAELLSATQESFTAGGGANWTITNDAQAATISVGSGIATIAGVAVTTANDASDIATNVAVVDDEVYQFSLTVGEVDLDGFGAGTDFDVTVNIGADSYDLTDADLVEDTVLTFEYTALATGNIEFNITFTALDDAADQSGVSIKFTAPSVKRETGSIQDYDTDGTLVLYGFNGVQHGFIVEESMATLVTDSGGVLVNCKPTVVNGSNWTGGLPVTVNKTTYRRVVSTGASTSIIEVKKDQTFLQLTVNTAIASLV
jgi:hypothetical protein